MPDKILEAAAAMSWPMWPALAPSDALCVPVAPPQAFLSYLNSVGLNPPLFVTPDEEAARILSGAPDRFTPFGWNAEAVRRNALRPKPTPHPSLEIVRRVNSRAFSLHLEQSLFGNEACPAWFCPKPHSIAAWVEAAAPGEYLAKGNHGLAGIGHLPFVIDSGIGPKGGEKDRSSIEESKEEALQRTSLVRSLERLAARHGGLVIETRLHVDREWALLFRISRTGNVSSVIRHRLLSTESGGYSGALALPQNSGDTQWNPHREKAEEVVKQVAAALHAEGYFGPVGIDVFTYRGSAEKTVIRLRPLVDLNVRQSMAWPVHGLASRFPDRAILFRQLPASSLKMPIDDSRVSSTYDILSYNVLTRRGAIWITPLLPLSRVSFAIVGHDEGDVLNLQEELLKRVLR